MWPVDARAPMNWRSAPPERCWRAVQLSQSWRSSAIAAVGSPQSQNGVSRSVSATMRVLSVVGIFGLPNIDTIRFVS